MVCNCIIKKTIVPKIKTRNTCKNAGGRFFAVVSLYVIKKKTPAISIFNTINSVLMH
jgi:hypothetical protein